MAKTSQADFLKDLKKQAPAKPKPGAKPTIKLPPAVEESFRRYADAKDLCDLFQARMEQEKGILSAGALDWFVGQLFKTKQRPPNPKIEIPKDGRPDYTGLFLIIDSFKISLAAYDPAKDDETEVAIRTIKDALLSADMDEAEAEVVAARIVNREISFSSYPVVDFNKLFDGHSEGEGKDRRWFDATDEEKALGSKVIAWLRNEEGAEPLTPEELARLFEFKSRPQIKDKKGFLGRVVNEYCKTEAQARALLRVITPTHYPKSAKIGVSDEAEEKKERRKKNACDILGVIEPGDGGDEDE